MNKSKIIGGVISGAALVIGVGLLAMSIEVIPQGHTGVVFSMSDGVQETTLSEGFALVNPLHRVTVFPVSTETINVSTFDVLTRDGKPLTMNMSYDFSVNPEMVSEVFTKFRGQSINAITDGWLEDRAMRATLTVFSQYSVLDVFQNLPQIQHEIFEEFHSIAEEYGFNIQAVTIQAPQMDDATMAAIQEVVNAQQQLERMEIERQQAIVQAETLIEEARGKAESELIRAEAQAEANELLQESLTHELIQLEMIRKWNGELPLVTGDSGFIIDLPDGLLGD